MTLRFTDSFDHYATAALTEKWTSITNVPTISAGNGRRSTASFRNATNVLGTATKTLDAQATWIIGFSFKMASSLPAASRAMVGVLDAGTDQCDLRVKADGTMEITRNGTVLGTTTYALSVGSTYYIEFKVVIHDTTGTAEVKVDGSSKLALTSVDTKNTANATANQVRIGPGGAATGFWDYDDVYICDGAGSVNNNFLGDCRVDAYAPNGNGNSSQLVGSDGNSTDNYLLVDESAPNDDTDYVESATAGNKDTYTVADMSHTPSSIFGVQILANAKKDDAGARSVATVTRSGVTDFDGATQALSTSYVYYSDIRETDPNTSAAWTKTNFNAAEFGVKVAA
ncbi:MAG: hypothetical protein M3436_16975 [Pseudomonadota bacterium]|nr:hypothetical protein [Pseudomonadota bacterium]